MKKMLKLLFPLFLSATIIGGLAGCKEKLPTGSFYTLQEAYEKGWLTKEDLMNIAYYHNGGCKYNEGIMSKIYEPVPKIPAKLSEDTERKIKSTAAKEYREVYHITDAVEDGFTIVSYYGTYNTCVAVMLRNAYSGEAGSIWTDLIAGVNFYYSGGKTIKIWRDAECSDIAYAAGSV